MNIEYLIAFVCGYIVACMASMHDSFLTYTSYKRCKQKKGKSDKKCKKWCAEAFTCPYSIFYR